jgi:hypothetical protein
MIIPQIKVTTASFHIHSLTRRVCVRVKKVWNKSCTKVKLSLCLTDLVLPHEGVSGSGCIDPHLLDLGTSWRRVVSLTPRPLYPQGKSTRCPLDRRLGGPQSRSERRGENSCYHRDSNSDPLVVHPVASRYTDCAILILTINNSFPNTREDYQTHKNPFPNASDVYRLS